jgi:hypothetical protein
MATLVPTIGEGLNRGSRRHEQHSRSGPGCESLYSLVPGGERQHDSARVKDHPLTGYWSGYRACQTLFRLIPGFKLTERHLNPSWNRRERSMLSWLVLRMRYYGAITLVALYAICVVMPSAALAFPSGSAPSHCLTDDHHRIDVHGSIHVHGSGAIGKRPGNSMEGGDGKLKCHGGACCGLFAAPL